MRRQRGKITPQVIEALSIPEPNSGCWLWLGYGCHKGYGRIYEGKRPIRAHRASWTVHRGTIPGGMHVCHRCDNRCCVNPDHLFLGTNADNQRDKVRKGRHVAGISRGHSNGASKLTEENVLEILASKLGPRALATQFGVNPATIHQIRTGVTWRHVPRLRAYSASYPKEIP
jgi:hypothetical protein